MSSCGAGPDHDPEAIIDNEWAYAHGADDVVLDYSVSGGYEFSEQFRSLVYLRVMGDGTVLLRTPDGGALDRYRLVEISPTLMQVVLSDAATAGVVGEPRDYSLPEGSVVVDAATTHVTARTGLAGEHVYENQAEALGADGTQTPERDALDGFVENLAARIENRTGPDTPWYEPKQVAVLIGNVSDGGGADVAAWPGPPLSEHDRCRVLKATPELIEAWEGADWLPRFGDGGKVYEMTSIKPVLPGDGDPCEGR